MPNASRDGSPLKILIAGSEVEPFARTGGLGDVLGALPPALAQLGHKPTVIMPAYRAVFADGRKFDDLGVRFSVQIGSKNVNGSLLRSTLPDSTVPILFVKQDDYYDRAGLYGNPNEPSYIDNCERFVFFNRAVCEAIRLLDLKVDVLHCNDWHTGLLPAYVKVEYRGVPQFERIASLMTIHNMQHQGSFWHWDMLLTGLDWGYFNWRQMEAYGNLNLLKTGLAFADSINTVSPRYAEEIRTPEFGCHLEGVLESRRDVLSGIINGVDYRKWNPATDPRLPATYGPQTVREGKAAAKADLQKRLKLDVRPRTPLVGFVGRLASQKGVDLIYEVMQSWVRTRDVQWVLLGTGDKDLSDKLLHLAKEHPGRVAVEIGFDDDQAHRIEAASDLFVMPSRFEPCGLNQLYSLKYGAVPVVHAVGGLFNTVVDASRENVQAGTATGFSFSSPPTGPTAGLLEEALGRAVDVFVNQPAVWSQIQQTGMSQDWSWDRSAADYVDLYRRTMFRAARHAVPAI